MSLTLTWQGLISTGGRWSLAIRLFLSSPYAPPCPRGSHPRPVRAVGRSRDVLTEISPFHRFGRRPLYAAVAVACLPVGSAPFAIVGRASPPSRPASKQRG